MTMATIRLPKWAGTVLTALFGLGLAFLAWVLPLAVRREFMDFERDGSYLGLMLFLGGFLGLALGAYAFQKRISLRVWLLGAGSALAWTLAVPATMFRGESASQYFANINHQRELIGWGAPILFVAVCLGSKDNRKSSGPGDPAS